jgi:hypothetical protein
MTRILEIQKSVMKSGIHFGVIPGTQKPTLLKPGAEKLLTTFQIEPKPLEVIDLSTSDEVRYRVLVAGISQTSGVELGAAWGECSSNEEKYRWRKPVCKEEFDETPADQRRSVWKKGQGGKPYKQDQVRTSPADVANTILQMASKRGLIPMTRLVLACSDIFDQDLEDMPEELRESLLEQDEPKAPVQPPQRKSQAAAPAASAQPAADGSTAVKSVVPRNGETNGRKWILFIVQFADGREASTLDEAVANRAIDARDNGLVVIPELAPGKKEGAFQLLGLKEVAGE